MNAEEFVTPVCGGTVSQYRCLYLCVASVELCDKGKEVA